MRDTCKSILTFPNPHAARAKDETHSTQREGTTTFDSNARPQMQAVALMPAAATAFVLQRQPLLPRMPDKVGLGVMAVAEQIDVASLQARRARLLSELDDIERVLEESSTSAVIGSRTSVFEPSFGYLSRSAGCYTESQSADGTNLPSSAFDLARRNFARELPELLKELKGEKDEVCCNDESIDGGRKNCAELREKLEALVLDNDAIWAREKKRPQVKAPNVILIPYYALCWVLDAVFDGRPIQRFWFLETVARMPYFAYVSSLHLYETLGWWRRSAEVKRVHFAEEWNEFHHLLTMEALGGDQRWSDRFLAQHAAILYYWILVGLWLLSPTLSYNFSELIEAHAVDTYAEFVDANRERLSELPAPRISRLYYNGPDLYFFDEFQNTKPRGARRPPCETLLDVFENIRDDEAEHVATMAACQDPEVAATAPQVEGLLIGLAIVGTLLLGVLTDELVFYKHVLGLDELKDLIHTSLGLW